MPDAIFGDPRLAEVYDPLDPDRSDLDVYVSIVADELGARSVLDVGCGTGTFALLLAERGLRVVGVDPAEASLDVARRKHGAEAVTWIVGTVLDAARPLEDEPRHGARGRDAIDRSSHAPPPMQVDAATMTANVAQVFLDDAEWLATLGAIRDALRPGGTLVFEARRPEARAWEGWTEAATRQVVAVPGIGDVEDWVQVTSVDGELVTFVSPTVFHADGTRIDSVSTLRFRSREAIEASLATAGLELVDVRDAPDRPGREWVYLARRPAEEHA